MARDRRLRSSGVTARDHRDAASLACSTGEMLRELRRQRRRPSGPARSTDPDAVAHRLLLTELRSRHPGDHVLSEEGRDDPSRLGAHRVWIIDPIDGTREYMEDARIDWAVHVALVADSIPAAGAIAIPDRELVYWTGARNVWGTRADGAPRLVVSRTRPPAFATQLAETLGLELVEMGSAGAKSAAVLGGEAVAYVHDGGMHEWDAAAPVAVATATGFHASHLDGSLVQFNQPRPWTPDLLVCRRERADEILTCLDRCR